MVNCSGWAWSACLLLLGLLGSATATTQPLSLSAALTLNNALRNTQHDMLDTYHIVQDERTLAKDANTLLHNHLRNLQNLELATNNAKVYHNDVQTRHSRRNDMVFSWNVGLNQSVQLNENIIKSVNQTNSQLRDVSEALDYQNVALLNEIGRIRDRRPDATYGLTLNNAEAIYRKISELVTWTKVEAIAQAHRQQKETYAVQSHHKWGQKQDLEVKASKLEAQVPTLKLQNSIQETLKGSETWKMETEKKRRDLYAAQVPALQTSKENLLAKVIRLRLDNAKLREHVSHLHMQRAALKQDALIQNTKEVNALLEKNAAEASAAADKALYEEAVTIRDNAINALAQHRAVHNEVESLQCQENVRELSKDIAYLNTQNSLLDEHCTGL